MDERTFRVLATLYMAVWLGLEILFAVWSTYSAGVDLHDRRWGWAAWNLFMGVLWTRLAVNRMQEINEHGILGRSPWDRDQEE